MNKPRADLPAMIPRIARLPIDERGYPVPFFVVWIDEKGARVEPGTGKPEFRAADPEKMQLCVKNKLCWVCGQPLGANKSFILGPMSTVNRVTYEPPSHLDCAQWSVKGCPFLVKPQMVRRENDRPAGTVGGVMIKENPGVMAIWTTRTYARFWAGNGYLIRIGDPVHVTWWTQGRPATTQEVLSAMDVGLSRLLKVCQGPEEVKQLMDSADRMKAMVETQTKESNENRNRIDRRGTHAPGDRGRIHRGA